MTECASYFRVLIPFSGFRSPAGGLPAFVEIGESFGGTFLKEDNIVSQLVSQGKRVAVLGDEAWLSLFPRETFSKAEVYPSYNVHDLDTARTPPSSPSFQFPFRVAFHLLMLFSLISFSSARRGAAV